MRTIRALMIATAIVGTLPTVVTAQAGRQFADSWFWGIKTGGITMADSGGAYRQSPFAGIDWLITRNHGGLYVSGAETFFTRRAFILRDPNAGLDSGVRAIDLKNMRKLDVAVMGFPGDFLRFHPYVGGGFTFSEIVDAQAEGPFSSTDQSDFADQVILDHRASFSPFFIAGGQYRLARASVFGQATLSPAQQNFILYNGRPYNFSFEFGLRYNFGTSISRE
ncbi:MAG TPA: hypothetical protein VII52_08515 [Gemmatimonadaceae bacterium]